MAPIYAGILGFLAFATSLAHGMIHAADTVTVLRAACVSLAAFAALGYVGGGFAARTVEESVRAEIQAELNAVATAESEAE